MLIRVFWYLKIDAFNLDFICHWSSLVINADLNFHLKDSTGRDSLSFLYAYQRTEYRDEIQSTSKVHCLVFDMTLNKWYLNKKQFT